MNNITWEKFKSISGNYQADFESLCRIFFKIYFVKDEFINLPQMHNNPGIEAEPINIKGKLVGFQAKFFEIKIDYTKILDSVTKTINFYKGKIDKIVLFCNKDLSLKCKSYEKIKVLLNKNNIELLPFCNNNILEIVSSNEAYIRIKSRFFNCLNLSNEWFQRKLSKELEDLEPRYVSGFHVPLEIEKYFTIAYRSKELFTIYENLLEEIKKDLENISYLPESLGDNIQKIIDSFEYPTKENINIILNWYKKLQKIDEEVNKLYLKQQEIKLDCFKNPDNYTEKEYELIDKEYQMYHQIITLISKINPAYNEYMKYINNNVFIIEGEAGAGKSHLLGYMAEKHGNKDNNTILLLGQKLFYDGKPSEQIMKYLDLPNVTFKDFLDSCEAKGIDSGCITVIMLDAINECEKHKNWKKGLNDLINYLSEYSYVKFFFTIRSTFKTFIFEENISKKIEKKEIPLIKHSGFKYNLSEAVSAFFNYYGIPITTAAYLENEFQNPLFLKVYCQTYQHKNDHFYGVDGMLSMFEKYILIEEKKIKEYLTIEDNCHYVNKILQKISKFYLDNNTQHIFYEDLLSITKNIYRSKELIDEMLKSDLLVDYYRDDKYIVYMGYEKFSDFTIARYVINKFRKYKNMNKWIKKHLFKVDKNGDFINTKVYALYGIISILAKEKFGKEIISSLKYLSKNGKFENYKQFLLKEYLSSYRFRTKEQCDYESYEKEIFPNIKTIESLNNHFNLMLSMAGRENSLNAVYLTKKLMSMSLTNRDYYWTIFLNNDYVQEGRTFVIVDYFLNFKLPVMSYEEIYLHSLLLIWFFASSNRKLRDKASRSVIKLFSSNINLMLKMLKIFININDSYVISRLFACIYGAILRSKKELLNLDDYLSLCNFIYEHIFNKEEVYSDILLRDYALNIIEYGLYIGISMYFDINKCRPPYRSGIIKKIVIEELNEKYPPYDLEFRRSYLGTDSIKSSMASEYQIEGFNDSMYGDFGRYVFGSYLSNFKNVDYNNVYAYAYTYIIDVLGYKNELFSEYDKKIGSGRGRSKKYNERIGKKYQWIAMYHTLALVADHYGYEEKYSDIKYLEYKGSWKPNVRDFDPTISITTSKSNEDLEINIQINRFKDWNLKNPNWVEDDKGINDFKKLVEVKGSDDQIWISLCYSMTDYSGNNYKIQQQSLSRSLKACLIKTTELDNFIYKIKDKSFYGRWLTAAEVSDHYNVFSREYPWSPAYKDQFLLDNQFQEVKIVRGNNSKGTYEDYEIIGKIMPCYESYIWEKQTDYGKDEAISYCMPNKYLVNGLNLVQINDGIWTMNDEVICVDFSLFNNSNVDGIYIKKEVLKKFLVEQELAVVWIGIGDKIDQAGYYHGKVMFNELSALVYYDKEGELIEIVHTNLR